MKTNQKPSLELLTSFLGLNHVLTLSYHNSQKQKWDKFKTLTRTIALTITVVILIYFGTLDFILRIIIQNEEQDHTIKLKQWSPLNKIGDQENSNIVDIKKVRKNLTSQDFQFFQRTKQFLTETSDFNFLFCIKFIACVIPCNTKNVVDCLH